MADNNPIAKYIDYSDVIKRVESNPVFKRLEESLVKTLDYLSSRFSVRKAYDYFNEPINGHDHEMLFKVKFRTEDIMWVYLIHSERSSYVSIEVDPDRVSSVRNELRGFDDIRLRNTKPKLKLIFREYERIEQSLVNICDCYGGKVVNEVSDINTPMKPRSVVSNADGTVRFICARCGVAFLKSPRCPECGQLVLFEEDKANATGRTTTLHVGDDVSGLKIYEIINKYFGENYSGWMKAAYDINDKYWAWFPKIYTHNVKPDGNYGGSVMWSNTLSADRKTIISMNHDATVSSMTEDEINNQEKRDVLVFGRINGAFQFLGVFDEKLVFDNNYKTVRHDRIAQGINLTTFELIDEDN